MNEHVVTGREATRRRAVSAPWLLTLLPFPSIEPRPPQIKSNQATYIASGSYDQSAVVWDAATGQAKQKWANAHEAPILDLSWRDDASFATGSADKTIKLFDVAQDQPIQTFKVRESERERGHIHACC